MTGLMDCCARFQARERQLEEFMRRLDEERKRVATMHTAVDTERQGVLDARDALAKQAQHHEEDVTQWEDKVAASQVALNAAKAAAVAAEQQSQQQLAKLRQAELELAQERGRVEEEVCLASTCSIVLGGRVLTAVSPGANTGIRKGVVPGEGEAACDNGGAPRGWIRQAP